MLIAYIDGSCEPPNPGGSLGIGIWMNFGYKIETHSECWPAKKNNTNNMAEYLALKRLLEIFQTLDEDELRVYTDSAMVAQQMNKRNKISRGAYKPTALACLELLSDLKTDNRKIQIEWIPRELNVNADSLSKLRY